jgi:hypothetical protein
MTTVPTCTVTLQITDPLGNPLSGIPVKYWPASDPDLVNTGSAWSIAQYQVKSLTTDSTGTVLLPMPQSASSNPTTQQYVIEPQMAPFTKWTGVVPTLSACNFSDLVLTYGWAVTANASVGTSVQALDLVSLHNQMVFPGYTGGNETITTVFNADGSISTTYVTMGVTVRTVFNSDGSITESFSGAMTHTKTTAFNANGSITESIA